ncbi:MAG: transporter substrate-binding domain-containing protein [Rhodospirillales bacterium]|nr:transporter substrate-binding domain-containing protein [Rhodospirillales bacterium]
MTTFITANITRWFTANSFARAGIVASIAICAAYSVSNIAIANERPSPRTNTGFLVAAFSVWEPFVIEDEDGKRHGIDVALLTEIADRLSLELHLHPCPWRRCLKTLEDGHIDVLTSFAYTKEREEYAFYIKPAYSQVTPVFYVNRNNPFPIEEYRDLQDLTVGAVVDSRYFEPFDSDTSLDKFEATNEITLLRMLAIERLDAIVGSDSNADFEIRRNQLEDTITKAPFRLGQDNEIHLVVSRKSPLMARTDQIAKIMQDLINEGFVDNLYKQYWPDKIPGNNTPTE